MRTGRPRSFSTDTALASAMDVFWRKGYEGASLADLTEAMGINPPSLYAAFGNKEGLFRAALARYEDDRKIFLDRVLAARTAREVAELFLNGVADMASGNSGHPPGCLLVQSALTCSDARIPKELARLRATKEAALCGRFERARKEGDLPRDAEPAALARYVMAVANGMCVQASAGAGVKELREVALVAIAGWPADRVEKIRKVPRERQAVH
ncbi:MAG TPA: TetR/AcrR family transcriptional regulator [Rhizomicrobium sp.]